MVTLAGFRIGGECIVTGALPFPFSASFLLVVYGIAVFVGFSTKGRCPFLAVPDDSKIERHCKIYYLEFDQDAGYRDGVRLV